MMLELYSFKLILTTHLLFLVLRILIYFKLNLTGTIFSLQCMEKRLNRTPYLKKQFQDKWDKEALL